MDIPEAKVRKVCKIMQAPISLETPIGEEGDSHLAILSKTGARSRPLTTHPGELKEGGLRHVLRTLIARQEKTIPMCFGMDDGSERTLEEVGRSPLAASAFARKAKALRKLRHPRVPVDSKHF